MISLVFDTETTGLFEKKAMPSAECQPDVLQLGALLTDGERIYAQLDLLVVPEQAIHPKALETHGISLELTQKFGVSRRAALSMFHNLLKQADRIVCHNVGFDLPVMQTMYHREAISDSMLKSKQRFCTMLAGTDVVKIPSPWRAGQHKWPSLDESYRALVNPNGFEGAHAAIEDVKACVKVLKALEANLPVRWWMSDDGVSAAEAAGMDVAWVSSWNPSAE